MYLPSFDAVESMCVLSPSADYRGDGNGVLLHGVDEYNVEK